MRNYLYLFSVLFLLSGCGLSLRSEKDKTSYAVGQEIGKSLKNRNLEVDFEILEMSLLDFEKGKPSRLSTEQISKAFQRLHTEISNKQKQIDTTALQEGKAFLEKNKANPAVQTTQSGLQYLIIQEGTGKTPSVNDTVKVHFVETLLSGQKVDSSIDRQTPAEFTLGTGMKGLSEALQLMKVGSKAKLFIPPELGYGATSAHGIPGNSVLVFEIELLDVVDAPKESKAPSVTR
jgi:FKBP-type peptidyl-prolyl cis-trans isomerase FkpA/FKBP-type peptidyl-prolyl cis-trans isomerase FklB